MTRRKNPIKRYFKKIRISYLNFQFQMILNIYEDIKYIWNWIYILKKNSNDRRVRIVGSNKNSTGKFSAANLLKQPSRTRLNFQNKRDVMTIYACNICKQNFTNKNIRDTHRKNICISSIIVRKQNGEKETIEKVNGKFNCVCERSFSRTDHFSSHWKECHIQGWNPF